MLVADVENHRGEAQEVYERRQSSYKPLSTFHLAKDRPYQQQFGDMYFLRLTKIKPAVEQIAAEAFKGVVIGGEPATRVDRVLDVRQGELCWVAGTVYLDMPLKPNILDDVSKDVGQVSRARPRTRLTVGSNGYPRPRLRKDTSPTTGEILLCWKTTLAVSGSWARR